LAHSPRGWTGARTPSAIKRVRQAERRRAVNQPRRSAAKTLISRAMLVATDATTNGGSAEDVQLAVQRAVSALDRAAKIGVIHKNAADRRKSRLMLKVNAVVGGEGLAAPSKSARQVGKAQAAKEAKARIAAGRAVKAKGAQTAAGKARAALARTSRTDGGETQSAAPAAEAAAPAKVTRATAKAAGAKATGAKAGATKASSSKTSTKASVSESKPRATKAATKKT
jgi:small subunit ribosomal protein S20